MEASNPRQPTNRPKTHTERKIYGDIKERARHMRKHPTQAEDALWQRLRKRQVKGLRFRRQHSIGPFIVDFYCFEARLVLEIDGEIHEEPGQMEYDKERQHYLESLGLRVLRFSNIQVLDQADSVLKAIGDCIAPLA